MIFKFEYSVVLKDSVPAVMLLHASNRVRLGSLLHMNNVKPAGNLR